MDGLWTEMGLKIGGYCGLLYYIYTRCSVVICIICIVIYRMGVKMTKRQCIIQ